MSRLGVGLTVAMMALMMFASVAVAAVVIRGNGGDNEITGTPGRDRIEAGAGQDTVDATQGGRDRVFGENGADDIDVGDGEDNDFVDCGNNGAEPDTANADPGDRVINCEAAGTAPPV